MRQTLKNIIGIGAITLFFYILFSVLNFAQAGGLLANTPVEPLEEPTPQYDSRRMVQQTIPVFCGDTSFMLETSSTLMEESQILVGEARLEGSGIGDIVGILSFGHNAKNNTGTFFITIPDESVTCVLGYGMNWKFFDNDGNQLMRQNSLIEIGPDITQD